MSGMKEKGKKKISNNSTRIVPKVKMIKKTSNTRVKKLEKYTWGVGIEHETHFFHEPKAGQKIPIKDFILFDAFNPTLRLLKAHEAGKITLSHRDLDLLENIPFEATGRKCNGEFVLQKAPINMPEFITTRPVSSLKTGKRGMESYCNEIISIQDDFIYLLLRDKTVKKQFVKYGTLMTYPFSMSNYVIFPKNTTTSTYKIDKVGKNNKVNPEYTGSYHITLTLPYTTKTTDKVFIERHRNYANQLQWLEPLLLTAFFSGDDKAVGTTEKRIRGSYRISRIGWGNLAGRDLRKIHKGIGRYSTVESHWRDGMEFFEKEKLKPCLSPTPPAIREGGLSALSSNFRTFDASKEDKYERSGAPMKKPYGMEFRIFDHFKDDYLVELCKVLIYVAENSRKHTTKKFVYKNKAWIGAVQSIMMGGWRAEVSDDYVKELREHLNLNIKTKSKTALDIFATINKELFQKHKNGDYPFLMLDKKYKKPPILPDINRKSWEHGFMIKLNRDATLLKKYNKFVADIPLGMSSVTVIKQIYKDVFKTDGWMRNFEDVLYYLERWEQVKLTKKCGVITHITLLTTYHVRNFNDEIWHMWRGE
jgi:hypothetical protein